MFRIRIHRIHMFLGPMDPDPLVTRCGSGSGSFCHKAKIVRETLISTILWLLFDFLSLKNYVKVPSKSTYNAENFFFNSFFVGILKVDDEIEGSGSISQRHGSTDVDPDPDPHQNVMDPEHWFEVSPLLCQKKIECHIRVRVWKKYLARQELCKQARKSKPQVIQF